MAFNLGAYISFKDMISIKIMKLVYVLGAAAITVHGLTLIVSANHEAVAYLGAGVLIVGNLLWRVFCESWIVLFRIHEALVELKISPISKSASVPLTEEPVPAVEIEPSDPPDPLATWNR